MIIKNYNHQSNVNTITPTTLSRPKGWVRIPACSQLKCLSPGHSRSWAVATSRSRETETQRARLWPEDGNWISGQDVEDHLHTTSHRQHVMETKQQTVMGNRLLWSQGGWGTGCPAGMAEVSARARSSPLPRGPGFGIHLCLPLSGKAVPQELGIMTEGHWDRFY